VNNGALAMQVIETDQNLLRDELHERYWESLIFVHPDEGQKVTPKGFKAHANVWEHGERIHGQCASKKNRIEGCRTCSIRS
jgi:hypothetical protein